MSIRLWITLLINVLIILIVSTLSFFFYHQFQNTLDQRVLLQLTSIKRLKRVQIEKYIQTEWQSFLESVDTVASVSSGQFIDFTPEADVINMDIDCLSSKLNARAIKRGIYDLSNCSKNGTAKLGLIKVTDNNGYQLKILGMEKIQEILLERTGMGESGETYLVAEDLGLRSVSRFFPDRPPRNIIADTRGVQQALTGQDGTGIFEDYRGIEVYSAYHKLNLAPLNWVILSEMDVAEVSIPLQKLRKKLWLIVLIMIFVALLLSLFIARFLAAPLLKMQDFLNRMSIGSYDMKIDATRPTASEIKEMFLALDRLKHSISQSIEFSSEIGNMNLAAQYAPASKNDVLGKSLIRMQARLIEYEQVAKQNSLLAKQSLISGQENERKRLSRELHDGLGPLLTTLKLSVQAANLTKEEKNKLSTIVDKTVNEIRRMTYDLMPPALVDFGVGKALLNFLDLIRKSTGITILYEDATHDTEDRFKLEIDICIFRVCQELIHNSIKHAEADKITISLTQFTDRLSFFYTDNGNGFDPEIVYPGAGLKNIKERIEVLNGYLQITSDRTGTKVEVEIPI